jgi:hypothetical protein
MALRLSYWEKDGPDPESFAQLKEIRLKSIQEAFPLALEHHRPARCVLVSLEQNRNYRGKKWIETRTVWEVGMSAPVSPIRQEWRTKK